MFVCYDANTGSKKAVGRMKATVVDNRDPEKRGRIQVECPTLGYTDWIPYVNSGCIFDPPEIGTVVYVEAESGSLSDGVAHGSLVKPEDAIELPEDYRKQVPSVRGMFSPQGHKFELDDGNAEFVEIPCRPSHTTENRGIRITTTGGNKIHISDDPAQQFINIEDSNGNFIKINTTNNEIVISSKDRIDTIAEGDQSEFIGGNLTITVDGDAAFDVTGNAVIDAAEIQLNGPSGDILTNLTDPVVDTIFGTPTVGVPTVKSG